MLKIKGDLLLMRYCTQCGRQMMFENTITDTQENSHSICNDCHNKTYQGKHNTKAGGWLLFWIIISILSIIIHSFSFLLGSFFIISLINSSITGDISDIMYYLFNSLATMGFMAAVVFQIIALRKLLKRQSGFLRLTQLFYIIYIASYIFRNISYSFDEFLGAFPIIPIDVIVGVIGILIWTLYFCRSKRVKAYMDNEEYMDKALFTIGRNKNRNE